MSYILDALRRADAERERGAVPGLNTQPTVGMVSAPEARGPGVPLPWVLGGGALLLAVGAVGWWWHGQAPLATPAGVAVAPSDLPGAAPSMNPATGVVLAPINAAPGAMVPQPQPQLQSPQPAPPTAMAPAAVPVQAPAQPTTVPPGTVAQAPIPAVPTVRLQAPAAVAPVPRAAPAAAAPPRPAAASAPARALTLAELPDAQRRQLTGLGLGGSVYSDRPAQRMVIIGGQVFHEGDRPTPDLRIEQIRPRSMVVNLGGMRVEVPL